MEGISGTTTFAYIVMQLQLQDGEQELLVSVSVDYDVQQMAAYNEGLNFIYAEKHSGAGLEQFGNVSSKMADKLKP